MSRGRPPGHITCSYHFLAPGYLCVTLGHSGTSLGLERPLGMLAQFLPHSISPVVKEHPGQNPLDNSIRGHSTPLSSQAGPSAGPQGKGQRPSRARARSLAPLVWYPHYVALARSLCTSDTEELGAGAARHPCAP